MISVSQLNQKLRNEYGYREGKVRFRIVWSEDMTEVRKGTFEKFSDSGNIYLGQETGFKQVKKYRFLKDRHILETVIPFTYPDIVTEHPGLSYECIYVFEDAEGHPLPLDWDMTQLFCTAWLQVFMKDRRSRSEQSLRDDEDKKVEKEAEMIADAIQHEAPNLAYGQGVVVPTNYESQVKG